MTTIDPQAHAPSSTPPRAAVPGSALSAEALKLLQQLDIHLTIGKTKLKPADLAGQGIEQAVELYNAARKTWTVADDINPSLLNPQEIRAFLEKLPSLPPAQLQEMQGQTIDLGRQPLKLHFADGVGVQRLSDGFSLTFKGAEGRAPAEVSLEAPADPDDLARTMRRCQEEIAHQQPLVEQLAAELAQLGKSNPQKEHDLLGQSYEARTRIGETQRVLRRAVWQALEAASQAPDRQVRIGDRTYTAPELQAWLKQLNSELEKAPAPPSGMTPPAPR